jgi:hypothetical protein
MSNILSGTKNAPHDVHARERVSYFTVAVLDTDSDGRIYPLLRFKASDRIVRVLIVNTAITGGTDYDMGFYTAANWSVADGTAKDADILFDGQSMATARDVLTDLTGLGTNAVNAADYGKRVWQLAGDSTEPTPGTVYDLCLLANTVGSASGTIAGFVEYQAGD